MIAVNTSALMAIVLNEPEGERCLAALERNKSLLISAGTCAGARIVAAGRKVTQDIENLLDSYSWQVVPVDAAAALRIERIYRSYGKNFHRASLNFGDCFAYDVAREHRCPLLHVGDDFAQTDIASALA